MLLIHPLFPRPLPPQRLPRLFEDLAQVSGAPRGFAPTSAALGPVFPPSGGFATGGPAQWARPHKSALLPSPQPQQTQAPGGHLLA